MPILICLRDYCPMGGTISSSLSSLVYFAMKISLSGLIFISIKFIWVDSYHVSSWLHGSSYGLRYGRSLLSSFSADAELANIDYPIKIKNVISKMTSSMQRGLNDKVSRMEVELPPAVSFGVESKSNNKDSKADMIRSSNREAARLVTEMFNMLSSSTTVLFPSGTRH